MLSLKCALLLSSFTLLITSSSVGQDMYLAVKGGAHLAGLDYSGTPSTDISPRVGWNAALVACYRESTAPWGASIEIGYNLKGAGIDADSLDYRLHFVGGPILFDYYLNERIKLSAGPEISILASAKNHANDSTIVDISPTFGNQFELGATFGASFSLSFFMDMGVRYNLGFSKIADFDPRTRASDIRTDYLQLFLLLKIAN